ncbi:hypothetical protein BDW75DRAFT_60540 [Aspergillus navahoensis]
MSAPISCLMELGSSRQRPGLLSCFYGLFAVCIFCAPTDSFLAKHQSFVICMLILILVSPSLSSNPYPAHPNLLSMDSGDGSFLPFKPDLQHRTFPNRRPVYHNSLDLTPHHCWFLKPSR